MKRHAATRSWRIKLLSAVVVAAVLGGVSVPAVIEELAEQRVGETESEMKAIAQAFQLYQADTGYWPARYRGDSDQRTTLRNYTCLYENSESLPGWNGPYVSRGTDRDGTRVAAVETNGGWEGLVDGWGRPFRVIYKGPQDAGSHDGLEGIVLLSSGPNLKFETSDDNALSERPVKDDLVQLVTSRVTPRTLAGPPD